MRSSTSLVTGLAHLALISKVTVAEYCDASPSPSWTTIQVPGYGGGSSDGIQPDRRPHGGYGNGHGNGNGNGHGNGQFPGPSQRFPTTTRNGQATTTTNLANPGETDVGTDPTDPGTDPVDNFDFQYSALFDFRNVDVATDGATPWSPFFSTRTWLRAATDVAPLELSYLPSEVYITDNTASRLRARQDASEPATYLTLRTQRVDQDTQAAAGLDYIDTVTTVSMSMLARVSGSSGAVAGFFTYYNDTTESDIEVLTRDGTSQVRLSNQPAADADSSFNVSVPGGRSTADWNVYRLDLLDDVSNWYLNGELVGSTTVNVPKDVDSTVTLNMWSNGGDFTGLMDIGGEAVLDVQWVELFYNSNKLGNVGGGDDGNTTTTASASGTAPVTAPSAGPTGGGGSSNGTFRFRG